MILLFPLTLLLPLIFGLAAAGTIIVWVIIVFLLLAWLAPQLHSVSPELGYYVFATWFIWMPALIITGKILGKKNAAYRHRQWLKDQAERQRKLDAEIVACRARGVLHPYDHPTF